MKKWFIVNFIILSNIFSCVRKEYNVQLITDAGAINDKSFNQQSYEAIETISLKYKKNYTFQQPAATNEQAFLNAYNAARLSGMQVMVASGFWHQSLGTLEKFATLMPEAKYIAIDFDMQNANLNWDKVKIAQLNYRSEESGFFAAIAGAAYLNVNNKNNKNSLKMTTFGGVMMPTVINFMAGYKIGINWWNKNVMDSLKIIRVIDSNFENDQLKKISFIGGEIDEHFSHSFSINSPNVQNILDRLISIEKADIIMPVAGPQILPVLEYIRKYNLINQTKVIGVDIDQATIYENYKNLFLTSALKKIKSSVIDALDEIYNPGSQSKFFQKQPYIGGIKENWTGISPSDKISEQLIKKIYDIFATDEKNWNLLKTVLHKPWEDLLKNNKIEDIWTKIIELE